MSAVGLGGTNAADFTQTNTCVGTPVAAGGTCTVSVRFTPAAAGARSATLTVTTNGASNPTVALTGTGSTATVPAAPVIGAVAVGAGSLTPSWTAPANGGSAITGYEVRVVSGGVQVGALRPAGATATSLLVTGLTPGTAYQFQVRATNAVGTGAFSALSAATTVPNVPGAPTIGTAAAGSLLNLTTEATARWTAPAATGGAPVTGYVVHALRMSSTLAGATVVSDTPVNAGAAARSLVVTGLVFGAPYRFEVQAVNLAGTGARSARSNAVTAF